VKEKFSIRFLLGWYAWDKSWIFFLFSYSIISLFRRSGLYVLCFAL